jgi:predicted extracellular nuclease/endonuclease I
MKKILKNVMLISALSCLLSATAMANVVITEYVEGSSSNKAIEISNLGSTTVDLAADGYKLALFSNGSVDEGNTELLTGTLAPNASLVIYNSGADPEFIFDAPDGIASTVTYFNGDDALVLTKADVIVDSFGRVGEDPGSEWTDANDANFSTSNKTLRRLSSVTTGDSVVDDAFPGNSNQWLTFDVNTADGLGCAGETVCSDDATGGDGSGDPVATTVLITEYIEGSSSNKAIEITNVGSTAVDLGADGYKLALFSNGSVDEGNTELLTGTLAPNASLVIYNSGADPEFIFDAPNGIASTVTYFNGDDALVLTKADVIVDSFGRVGEDPGSEWTDANDANFSTANKTLRRLSAVTAGDVIVDDAFPGSSNQWLTFDQNKADGLGCSGEGACSSDNTGGGNASVIITEYIEGSSSNKAIEITNIGSTSVDLGADGYKLALFSNGSVDEGNTELLTGTLAPNASLVIYNSGADPEFIFDAPNGIASTVTYFNGDDALVLTKADVIVDSFGRVGEDPGSEWTDANDANFSTSNKTLRRLSSVTTGDVIINDAFPGSSNQWLTFDQNTADGLGCSGEGACSDNNTGGDNDPVDEIVLITEYIEGSGSNKAIEITNLGSTDVDLGAGEYKLALYSNGNVDEGNTELLTGILAPNASLVIYNAGADPEFIIDPPNGIASTVTFFNGDDALVLTRAGVIVDSFGRVGEDPGSEWTDANSVDFSSSNKTLRRLNSVTTGDVVINDAFPGTSNQWLTFDQDTSDGLGCAGEALCSNDNTGGGDTVDAIVLITEYIEGGSSNKAIEITNLGSADVDLDAGEYKLALYSNGSVDEGNTEFLTGILAPNTSLVVYNASADPEFVFDAPDGISSQVTFFNGDDALVLTRAGVIVDSFGRVGEDPGSEWTDENDANFSTANKTLRRLSSVTTGDTIIDDAFPGTSNQWLTFDQDTSDGLGCPGEGICSNDDTGGGGGDPVDANVLITEYVEGSSNNKAFEISNLGTESVDLFTAGYRLEAFNNGNVDPSNSENLIGILVPNSSIVIYNSGADDEFKKSVPQGIASNVTFINGDDAVVLTVNGTIVDSLGRVGEDPGSEWTDPNDPNFSTANKTLRRLSSVTTGDLIVDDVFPNTPNEWLVFDQNTADGLGCPGESACTGNEPLPLEGEGVVPQTGLCLNCPDITKVADASTFIASDYYAEALAADSAELRSKVNTIITTNHIKLSYGEVWSVLTFSDEDPANTDNIITIYKGESLPKFSNGSGNQSSDPDAWNREHVWSKSHGFPDQGQFGYTDAHHLRPSDASMNSTRSNYDFEAGGIPVDEAPLNSIDSANRTFEPRDEVKGDVARMMFYMDVRYAGASGDNTPNLMLVDNIGTATGTPLFGKLCTLYDWHLIDAVSASETQRNDVVFEYQGNRNPFIDYPEWVDAIFGSVCMPNSQPEINITGDVVVSEGAMVTIDASGSSDIDNDQLTFQWMQLTTELISFDTSAATLSFQAPQVEQDEPIKFQLTVSDGLSSVTTTYNVVVENKESGGSVAWLSLLLLSMLYIRNRKTTFNS